MLRIPNRGDVKVGKLGGSFVLAICAAVAADRYLNDGNYTDGVIAMARQIRSSFGW